MPKDFFAVKPKSNAALAGQKTYTVNGEIVKTLVSGPKAVVAVTPGDTLSVMAGEAQEYTAQFTAEGVVSGSVKGLGDGTDRACFGQNFYDYG